MSSTLKRVAVVAAVLVASSLFGLTVGGGIYGASYATGWEGPQLGPLLIYRSTFSALAGLLCTGFPVALAGTGYAVYRFSRKAADG